MIRLLPLGKTVFCMSSSAHNTSSISFGIVMQMKHHTVFQDGPLGRGRRPWSWAEIWEFYLAKPTRIQLQKQVLVVSLSVRQRPCGALLPERLC